MAEGDYKYLAYSTFYHKDVTSIDDSFEETFSDSRFSKILLDGTFTDIGIGITSYPEDSAHKNLLEIVLAYPQPAPTAAPAQQRQRPELHLQNMFHPSVAYRKPAILSTTHGTIRRQRHAN
jgi:hypothetical protein